MNVTFLRILTGRLQQCLHVVGFLWRLVEYIFGLSKTDDNIVSIKLLHALVDFPFLRSKVNL